MNNIKTKYLPVSRFHRMLGFEHQTQTSLWSLGSRGLGLHLHLQLLVSVSGLPKSHVRVVMANGDSPFPLKYVAAYWRPELIIACAHIDVRLCWAGLQHCDELFDSSASAHGAWASSPPSSLVLEKPIEIIKGRSSPT